VRAAIALCAATACGRLGFDPRVAPADGARDAVPDSPATIALVAATEPGFQKAAMVSFSVAQTAGDFLVVAVYWDEAPDTVTFGDSLGLPWQSLPVQGLATTGCGGPTGNATGAQLWYASVAQTGTNTLTAVQTSGTQPLGMFALEYSGVDGANAIDTTAEQLAPTTSSSRSSTTPSRSARGEPARGSRSKRTTTIFRTCSRTRSHPPGRTCRPRRCRPASTTRAGSALRWRCARTERMLRPDAR
jgi:hypothetical protein